MEFEKEFVAFLHEKGAIKFGDFVLSGGVKSSYYIDLRLVPSFPHQFRRTIKHMHYEISQTVGLDGFGCLASVPTGGLMVASALALEILKPLIYVRSSPKVHGTSKIIEGSFDVGARALMIDDVATTGGSMLGAIEKLREAGLEVTDAFVVVDRMEGATDNLLKHGVKLHSITDIMSIARCLHGIGMITDEMLKRVKSSISS